LHLQRTRQGRSGACLALGARRTTRSAARAWLSFRREFCLAPHGDATTVPVAVPDGFCEPRPSGTPGRRWRPDVPASPEQRGRTEVTGRSVTTLLARRRPLSELGQPNQIVLPVECPVAQLCGALRGAGWSYRHNCVPGTSRWRVFSACPAAAAATFPGSTR
jgi:hypothetical protein